MFEAHGKNGGQTMYTGKGAPQAGRSACGATTSPQVVRWKAPAARRSGHEPGTLVWYCRGIKPFAQSMWGPVYRPPPLPRILSGRSCSFLRQAWCSTSGKMAVPLKRASARQRLVHAINIGPMQAKLTQKLQFSTWGGVLSWVAVVEICGSTRDKTT
ncbi:hypothetical protein VTK26DRAFT_9389 [Humicola hyalothermophila]